MQFFQKGHLETPKGHIILNDIMGSYDVQKVLYFILLSKL